MYICIYVCIYIYIYIYIYTPKELPSRESPGSRSSGASQGQPVDPQPRCQ